jgi:hypothetical protein
MDPLTVRMICGFVLAIVAIVYWGLMTDVKRSK